MPELLIVIVIVGVVAAALATAFSVVVRTNPGNVERNDDARALLGLNNFFATDLSSAPGDRVTVPSSFTAEDAAGSGSALSPADASDMPAACVNGVSPAGSVALVGMYWSEGARKFVVHYRLVDDNGWVVQRLTCFDGVVRRQAVTVALADSSPLPLSAPIVTVVQKTVQADLDNNGTPDGDPVNIGVEMIVTMPSGDRLRVNGESDNPTETLPDLPPLPDDEEANNPPTVADTLVDMWPDETKSFRVNAVDDPGDVVALIIDGAPPGWSVVTTGTSMTVTASGALQANSPYQITYLADDGQADPVAGRVIVTITDPSISTTTTTTTAPPLPACRVTAISISASQMSNNAGRNDKESAKLDDDVTVTVTSTGYCPNLVLLVDPAATGYPAIPGAEEISFTGTSTALIQAKDFFWLDGFHTLVVRNGVSQATDLATIDLEVT